MLLYYYDRFIDEYDNEAERGSTITNGWKLRAIIAAFSFAPFQVMALAYGVFQAMLYY